MKFFLTIMAVTIVVAMIADPGLALAGVENDSGPF